MTFASVGSWNIVTITVSSTPTHAISSYFLCLIVVMANGYFLKVALLAICDCFVG